MAAPHRFPHNLVRGGARLRLLALAAAAAGVGALGLPSSPAPASEGHQIAAPLVVEAVDPSIDTDDPDLIAAMADIHQEFEPGITRPADGSATGASGSLTLDGSTASAGGGITVTFDAGNPSPSNVQTVVLAAANQWNQALATSPSGPIEVAVIWTNLGHAGLLGSAGPTGLLLHPSLPTAAYYPYALANTLLNTDVNGASPELTVNLNSIANWYIGTSGSPSAGQVDLYSVVLHELAHGLGFLGSASSATLGSPTFVYDNLVTYNGAPLVNAANPNSLLTSNSLYIDLSQSFQAKVYAPSTWTQGSSFSHFDESSYPWGWPGALMTPSLTSQEVERTLDGPTLGVMASMGWPMDAKAITPSITSTSTTSSSVTVNWGLNLGLPGVAPDGFRVEAWRNGTTLDGSYTVSGGTTAATINSLVGGSGYTVKVIPYAHGVDGTAATASVTLSGTPGPPTMVRVSGSGLTRTVTWAAASGTGITSYTVERSTDGTNWTSVGSTASTTISSTVPAGVHQYRVRGTNGYGPGAWGYSIPTGIGAGVERPVALDGQIARLYRAYFLRSADTNGFLYWQSQRSAGLSLNGLSNAFAASAEFQNTYGPLNNGAFVDLVYSNVLGRPADAGGRAYWMSQLNAGVSRGQVMTGFSESSEMINATGTVAPTSSAEAQVYRLYVAFFLRHPDPAGFQYWAGVRASGASLQTIASAFAGSAEFIQTYGSLPDSSFVILVYANLRDLPSDPTRASYWQSQLGAGVNRGAMMVGFSESPEFIVATGKVP